MNSHPAICDYEGSAYRTEFWTQSRAYEDLTERLALRRLLPGRGHRLIEIGAGFGRMADEYQGYDEIVLVDYSRSLLQEAQQRLGRAARIRYVAASVYQLPFVNQVADTTVTMRVMHHLADVPAALRQMERTTRADGQVIIEYANKRNFKAIARYLLGRQRWSPFSLHPYEFVTLNFDFHPDWMKDQFGQAGLRRQEELAVSHFRIGWLKRHVAPATLAAWDARLFRLAAPLYLAPSIWVRATPQKPVEEPAGLFACPRCGTPLAELHQDELCPSCHAIWPFADGIYDFREPLAGT